MPASCTTSKGEVIHSRQRPHARLWRAGGWPRSGQTPPKDVAAQGPEGFRLIGKPLKRLDTPDKVNGKAVYGIDAMPARHEVRHAGAMPGVRRQGRQGRRQRGEEDPGRAPGRGARRSRRRGRRPHVGRQEGPRRAQDRLERGPEREAQFDSRSGSDLRAASAKDGVVAKRSATSPRALAAGDKFEASLTSCRSWRTPRWSR